MDKTTFNLGFGLLMCGWPVIIASLFKTQPGADTATIKRLTPILWVSTVLAAGIVVYFAPVTHMTWVMCFPLWFGLANRIHVAKNPGLAIPQGPTRTASLKVREVESPIPTFAWTFLVLYVLAGATAIGVLSPEMTILPWVMWSGALLWLGLTPWACKAMIQEPEPMDSGASEELAKAYEQGRNFRAWAFFVAGLAAITLFQGVAVLLVLGKQKLAIWIGAGGGTLVGLGGGIVGTLADARRAKVANLRHALENDASPS